MSTYLRERANGIKDLVVELAGETLEPAHLVDVVGLALDADPGENLFQGIIGVALLQLDNVLSRDDLTGAGLEDRGAPVDRTSRSRSGQNSREESGK